MLDVADAGHFESVQAKLAHAGCLAQFVACVKPQRRRVDDDTDRSTP
jgi:hypothetical protein